MDDLDADVQAESIVGGLAPGTPERSARGMVGSMDPPSKIDVCSPYTYEAIDGKEKETRYIMLMPGSKEDDIIIELTTISLAPCKRRRVIMDIDRVREFLPQGWSAWITPEDWIIYTGPDGSSWNHPNPEYDKLPKFKHELSPFRLPFEALSYTWGDTKISRKIFVRTEYSYATLLITQNLFEALQALRDRRKPRALWIDAICIDQNNIQERSSQVAEMDLIYRYAKRVVVWLGQPSSESSLALRALQNLGQQIQITKDNTGVFASPGYNKEFACYRSEGVIFDQVTKNAINSLFQRPWFRRLWILQEIQLAGPYSIILCGIDVVTWSAFRRSLQLLQIKNPALIQEHRVNSHMFEFGSNWYGMEIKDVLRRGARSQCRDPRDFIYGLLAFIPYEIAREVTIDYSASAANAFQSLFRAYLKVIWSAFLIDLICLPSQQQNRLALSPISKFSQGVSAGSDSYFTILEDGAVSLKGYLYSSVRQVARVSSSQDDWIAKLRYHFRSILDSKCTAYPEHAQGWKDVLTEVFSQSMTDERFPGFGGHYPTYEEWQAMFDGDKEPTSGMEDILNELYPQSLLEFDTGDIGLGPTIATPSKSPKSGCCNINPFC